MAEPSVVVTDLDDADSERAVAVTSDEEARGEGATRDRLWFLTDRPALLKRFVLSTVLGTPRSRTPRMKGHR